MGDDLEEFKQMNDTLSSLVREVMGFEITHIHYCDIADGLELQIEVQPDREHYVGEFVSLVNFDYDDGGNWRAYSTEKGFALKYEPKNKELSSDDAELLDPEDAEDFYEPEPLVELSYFLSDQLASYRENSSIEEMERKIPPNSFVKLKVAYRARDANSNPSITLVGCPMYVVSYNHNIGGFEVHGFDGERVIQFFLDEDDFEVINPGDTSGEDYIQTLERLTREALGEQRYFVEPNKLLEDKE